MLKIDQSQDTSVSLLFFGYLLIQIPLFFIVSLIYSQAFNRFSNKDNPDNPDNPDKPSISIVHVATSPNSPDNPDNPDSPDSPETVDSKQEDISSININDNNPNNSNNLESPDLSNNDSFKNLKFTKQIQSLKFIGFALFFGMNILRFSFYLAGVHTQLSLLGQNNADYTEIFVMILPLGVY